MGAEDVSKCRRLEGLNWGQGVRAGEEKKDWIGVRGVGGGVRIQGEAERGKV